MGTKTYIFNQAGCIAGVPGTFAGSAVTVDDAGNVLAINGIPQTPVTPNAVSLLSPPAQTTANTDTTLTFVQQVNHVEVQNNSPFDVFVAYNQAATQGSLRLPPNALFFDDVQATTVHLLTAGTTSINGNAQPNIYVGGVL